MVATVESERCWGPAAGSVMQRMYDLGGDEEGCGMFVHAVTNAPAEDVSRHGSHTPVNLQSCTGTNVVLMILPSIDVFQKSPVKPCASAGFRVEVMPGTAHTVRITA